MAEEGTNTVSSGDLLHQLRLWGLANVLKQHFDLGNAVIAKQLGAEAKTIPFGSTIVQVTDGGGWLRRVWPLLVTGMLAASGVGGGVGWIAHSLLGTDVAPLPSTFQPVPNPMQSVGKERVWEGVVEWGLDGSVEGKSGGGDVGGSR